jgi:probable HAF family extracellular repeat protein
MRGTETKHEEEIISMNINKNYAHQVSRTLSALALLCVLAVQPTLAQSFSGAQAISDNGLIVGGSTGTGIIFNAFLLDREGFHDLGTFGGPASVAFSVNARGDVVGQSDTPDLDSNGVEYISVAFLADREGVHNLGTLPGFNHSQAYGVNNRGQVVGWTYNQDPAIPFRTLPTFRAFLYHKGTMVDIGTLGGATSIARSINDSGRIVGSSRIFAQTVSAQEIHAFVYEHGEMTDLGTLPGFTYAEALAINNRGQIVGHSGATRSSPRVGFLYDRGVMSAIGTLGGVSSTAWAINDRGQVVGWSRTASGETHAFLYERGRMRDLGTLGGSYSLAFGINNRGDIVGESETAEMDADGNPVVHAFLYRDGVMHDLGTLP